MTKYCDSLTKRVLDWSICLALLPVAVPAGLVIAIAIKLDSKGPVLFTQPRVGRNGHLFHILKFRTMEQGFDDSDHREFMRAYIQNCAVGRVVDTGRTLYKPDQDKHLTRVGRLLRKVSLDELPQVLNVFKGDMSLVGPRPHVPWEVEVYQPRHRRRLKVLPGITGLAQVRGRSEITFNEMVDHDLEYVATCSLSLDLRILGQTLLSCVRREGAG